MALEQEARTKSRIQNIISIGFIQNFPELSSLQLAEQSVYFARHFLRVSLDSASMLRAAESITDLAQLDGQHDGPVPDPDTSIV